MSEHLDINQQWELILSFEDGALFGKGDKRKLVDEFGEHEYTLQRVDLPALKIKPIEIDILISREEKLYPYKLNPKEDD